MNKSRLKLKDNELDLIKYSNKSSYTAKVIRKC
jgi:hypothetical protein